MVLLLATPELLKVHSRSFGEEKDHLWFFFFLMSKQAKWTNCLLSKGLWRECIYGGPCHLSSFKPFSEDFSFLWGTACLFSNGNLPNSFFKLCWYLTEHGSVQPLDTAWTKWLSLFTNMRHGPLLAPAGCAPLTPGLTCRDLFQLDYWSSNESWYR